MQFKILFSTLTLLMFFLTAAAQQQPAIKNNSLYYNPIKVIPANYYTKSMGVICKQELQLQKKTGLNIYFRLGSKTYVDYLEKKPNASYKLP